MIYIKKIQGQPGLHRETLGKEEKARDWIEFNYEPRQVKAKGVWREEREGVNDIIALQSQKVKIKRLKVPIVNKVQ